MSPAFRSAPLLALVVASAVACADRSTGPTEGAVARPLAAQGMSAQQQATGSAFIQVLGGATPEQYEFNAIRHRDGEVTGQMELKSAQDGGLRVHADVTCLQIIGNVARIGGVLTQSDQEQFPAGSQVFWMVVDNGEGANAPPDLTSDVYGTLDASRFCASLRNLPLLPVERGNLQVHE